MKTICKACIYFAVILLCTSASALAYEGPYQVKNLYPLFLHADQPYIEKAEMENSVSFSLSHSSTYTVDNSGRWMIDLDMEITEFTLRYKRIIGKLVELDLDIPVLIISNGFMDGFLEEYHDTFGFDDYGRSQRPHDEFLYEVRKDGNLVVRGKSGTRLGDIRLAVKKSLLSSDDYTLSLKGDVELPVSEAKKGFSNGSIDAAVAVLYDKRISGRVMTYWNLGAVFPGDVKGYETVDLKNFIYGGAAIEANALKNLNLLLQLQWQSSVYPDTGVEAVDGTGFMIVLGGRYGTEKRSMELSLTEDLNTSGAPDFIVNLTYKIRL